MDKLTRLLARITVALLLTFSGGQAMAIEEPDYAAVREGRGFELRRYARSLTHRGRLVQPRGSAARPRLDAGAIAEFQFSVD
ncbi:hypothetical protein [Halochromatium glycolicum]|uniref:Uncharacterized protein n=1 Tax=Halochromatium glycolicum TaxID=85075 RepID=A0AAJ0XC21_9GAMM|nr:hypothetical protein [Halochromatium glycolicum]MBK1706477.1 hypothetical protein [Halochromatium glycolicum]